MDGATAGMIGGILGGVIGLAGGAIGTYFSIKNTQGPRERAFMIRCAVVMWIAIAAFLGLLLVMPTPYEHYLWTPYALVLVFGIIYGNRRQREIRQAESAE